MQANMGTETLKNQRFFLRAGESYNFFFSGLLNEYSFIILSESFTDEGDDSTLAKVIPLTSFDQTIEAVILDHLDIDFFSFTITEETTIYMTYSGQFVGLYESTDLFNPLVTDSTQITLQPGTYYLKFEHSIHQLYEFIINTVTP